MADADDAISFSEVKQAALAERKEEIVDLFTAAFSHSEGEEEGKRVGGLARELVSTVPAQDIFVFIASARGAIVGTIVFTRLSWPNEKERTVFLLSPVAVASDQQKKGVGQGLLRHGLAALQKAAVHVVITYGSPNYYKRVGFAPVSTADVPPPLPPSHPEGWLGQSLNEQPLTPLEGPSYCVTPLNNPVFW